MYFSTIFSFAILLATTAANLHNECVCWNGQHENTYLTISACKEYAASKYKWGVPVFDNEQQVCTGVNNGKIAGNQWEDACKSAAQHNSYPCPSASGNGWDRCWASVKDVRGACG